MFNLVTVTVALMASVVTAQYTNQSAPFYLVLHSHDKSLNGMALDSCHEGAAIEALCVAGAFNKTSASTFPTYNLNTSNNAEVANASLGAQGYLTWEISAGTYNCECDESGPSMIQLVLMRM